jgi:g-D-glutamyl-meso-diaminopimelate peptidase
MKKSIFILFAIILVLCGILAAIYIDSLTADEPDTGGDVQGEPSTPGDEPDTPVDQPSDPAPNDPQEPEAPVDPPVDEPAEPSDPAPEEPAPEAPPVQPAPVEGIVALKGKYYTYAEMKTDLAELAARHPDHMSYRSYGVSADGRNLYVVTLGNADAEKQVIITSGMHAREYVNPYVIMCQLEYYLENYDTLTYQGQALSALLETVCFVIVPMANPDGITISQEGISALRTPALREQLTGMLKSLGITGSARIDAYLNKEWKSNVRGVDINRNFNALWGDYYSGMNVPTYKNYKGPMPVSEPETAALVTLTESLSNPVASVCMHMQGQVIYWRCFQQGTLLEQNRRLADIAQAVTGYLVDNDNQTEPSYSNWTILAHQIPTITVETGLSTYPLNTAYMANGIFDKTRLLWAALACEYANQS